MRRLSWIIFVVLSVISQWRTVVDGRLLPHERASIEARYGPDAEIEAFMRNHNIGYPPQHDSRPPAKEVHPGLQYYYNYEDPSPVLLDSHGYPNPPHYGGEDLTQSEQKYEPQASQHQENQIPQEFNHASPQEFSHESLASEKIEPKEKSKPQEEPTPVAELESPNIKMVARAKAGHLGANEVVAVAPGLAEALRQDEEYSKPSQESSIADVYLLAVIAGCAVAAVAGLALTGVCWYRLHKRVKAASDVEYPAYGVTGPAKEKSGPPGDRKLAQSAQMYHYQHQKQQMLASERIGSDQPGGNGGAGSEGESDEECEEGDYTVFECPGLATAGEMEVRNPLFNDQTPVATPAEK